MFGNCFMSKDSDKHGLSASFFTAEDDTEIAVDSAECFQHLLNLIQAISIYLLLVGNEVFTALQPIATVLGTADVICSSGELFVCLDVISANSYFITAHDYIHSDSSKVFIVEIRKSCRECFWILILEAISSSVNC